MHIPGCSKVLLHFDIFISNIRIITIILFNVTSFSSNDTAQTWSETLANFTDEIFSHRGLWTITGRLQLLYTAVANCTGLALNMRPNAVVEGVRVRRLWWQCLFDRERLLIRKNDDPIPMISQIAKKAVTSLKTLLLHCSSWQGRLDAS